MLLRKEVIQPHLPVRLPCYDFTPIADPTFDGSLQMVGPPASGVTHFRGVTGGDCDALEPSSHSHRTSASRASGEPDSTLLVVLGQFGSELLRHLQAFRGQVIPGCH